MCIGSEENNGATEMSVFAALDRLGWVRGME